MRWIVNLKYINNNWKIVGCNIQWVSLVIKSRFPDI
jgi:hypothetical protein